MKTKLLSAILILAMAGCETDEPQQASTPTANTTTTATQNPALRGGWILDSISINGNSTDASIHFPNVVPPFTDSIILTASEYDMYMRQASHAYYPVSSFAWVWENPYSDSIFIRPAMTPGNYVKAGYILTGSRVRFAVNVQTDSMAYYYHKSW